MSLIEDSIHPEQLLKDTAWLKSLAFSLVRDAALAEDVVQETWLAAVNSPPVQARAARSWLTCVVRNLSHRVIRDRARRRKRERLVARSEKNLATPEQLLQRVEVQREVMDAVVRLKEPYRTTVLLRFFEELAPKDIARRQGVPVTTVRSRLTNALEQLRVVLDRRYGGDRRTWSAIVLPLAGLPPIANPSRVSWLKLGGIVMTKKTKCVVAAMLLAGATGISTLMTWGISGSDPEQRTTVDTPETHVGGQDSRNVQAHREEARGPLKTANAKLLPDQRRIMGQTPNVASRAKTVEHAPALPPRTDAIGIQKPSETSMNWSDLTVIMEENFPIIVETVTLHNEGKPIPDALKNKIIGFLGQSVLVGMKIKGLSRYPLLDRDIYDNAMTACLKGALDFSEPQLKQVSASIQEMFNELLGGADPSQLLPIERYRVRHELWRRGRAAVEGTLEEHQRAHWNILRLFDDMEEGQASMIVGRTPMKDYGLHDPNIAQDIVDDWQDYFSLNGEQVEPLTESTADYVRRVRETVENYGTSQEELTALSRERKQELIGKLLEIQEAEEMKIAELLSDDQLDIVQQGTPFIHRFHFGLTADVQEHSFFSRLVQLMGKK